MASNNCRDGMSSGMITEISAPPRMASRMSGFGFCEGGVTVLAFVFLVAVFDLLRYRPDLEHVTQFLGLSGIKRNIFSNQTCDIAFRVLVQTDLKGHQFWRFG